MFGTFCSPSTSRRVEIISWTTVTNEKEKKRKKRTGEKEKRSGRGGRKKGKVTCQVNGEKDVGQMKKKGGNVDAAGEGVRKGVGEVGEGAEK